MVAVGSRSDQIELALFFHVLGALLFAGGAIVAGVAFEAARRRNAPAEVALLLGLARSGAALLGLGGAAVLGFGLWLVELASFGFDTAWIQAALGLFAVSFVLGGVGGRGPRRARVLAARLAREGADESTELRRLLDDPVSRVVNYVSAALVVAILALMIWKPT